MMLLFQCAKINKVSRIQEVKVVIYFKREKKAEKGKMEKARERAVMCKAEPYNTSTC